MGPRCFSAVRESEVLRREVSWLKPPHGPLKREGISGVN